MSQTMEQHITEVFNSPIDKRLISTIEKAGTTLDYISGSAVIHLLKKAFGPIFSIEYGEPKITTYETIKDKKGEYTPKQVLEVKCTITAPIFSDKLQQVVYVKQEGFGTCIMKRQFEEMMLKTAQTDALKKAASQFGIDAELRVKKNPQEYEYFAENVYNAWIPSLAKKYAKELSIVKEYMNKNQIENQNTVAVRLLGENRLTPKNIVIIAQKIREAA